LSAIQYISFIAIHVSDLERSRRFYREALGFREISHLLVEGRSPSAVELGLESLRTEGVFIERDGMRLQLQHQDIPVDQALPEIRRQMGLSHFGIRIENLDETLELVRRFGGTTPAGHRHTNEEYGSQVARVLDPDGVRMELLQMPGDITKMPGVPIAETTR
jgi:catechol 2,3-dioxygenase-like lactoylglutathione lyase family enzyme